MRLRRQSLDVLLLHRASHLTEWGGKLWQRLLGLKKDNIINALGVSVQNPQELVSALNCEAVGLIQMPLNILDWRWDELENEIIKKKQARSLIVHVRSTLLQGLLLSFNHDLWRRANLTAPGEVLNWLVKMSEINGCSDVADLCFRYVRSKSWVDGIVVGIENQEQMLKNISYFNNPKINYDKVREVELSRPLVTVNTLNPSLWCAARV
jgi:aryl-alcohol dehydrogenase-like predicted oxidoreductase